MAKEKKSKKQRTITVKGAQTENRAKEATLKPQIMKKSNQSGKRFFTLSRRLLLLCLLPMILVCLVIASLSASRLRSSIEAEIEKSLKIVAASVNETYTNLYEGDYTKDIHGRVSKGDVQISDETGLIDSLNESTGFHISMFYGNNRLITNVRKANGARITGVGIEGSNYSIIEQGQELFLKNYSIDAGEYYAYYMPLINSDGSVVGAVEAVVETSSVNETINAQVFGIFTTSVLLLIPALLAVVFLSRGLVNGLVSTQKFLAKIVKGELDRKPDPKQEKRNDELGDIYRMAVSLQHTLYQIVTEIKHSAGLLSESADQLTDMAQDTQQVVDGVILAVAEISQGAQLQAKDTSDTNENIIKMGQQIDNIADEVENLSKNAGRMAKEERESERIISELNLSSTETKEAVMQVAEQITLMSKSIKNITATVEMIQNVADETNLLALNASIEAARVGEAGRGFAVVAEQIGKLAVQSNSSIVQIENIVEDVVATSEKMVFIMENVKQKMEQQQSKLEETMSKSVSVSNEVESSKKKIEKIRGNVDALNEFGNAIGGAVGNLAAVSSQNAASADNTKDSADSMSETMSSLRLSSEKLLTLAAELEQSLGAFKL